MAVPKDTIHSLLECQCQICVEILIEPVTLPCKHTLCKACFKSTVEKTNLCCPSCHCQIAFWTWYHTQRNSLVNVELVSGQQSEEIVDDYQSVHLLSQHGELRREYEEERKNKASEEYIQRLLKSYREMEEQLKSNKALARRRNLNISNIGEESVSTSLLNSKKSDPVTTKSQRKRNSKLKNTGDSQKYLSPNSQLGSASQFEVVEEDRKTSMSKETDSSDVKNPTWQDTEIEGGMPAFSPQICLESPKPQLFARGGEWYLEGSQNKAVMKKLCVTSHKEPKVRVPSSGEAAIKPHGKTESGCTVSDITQTLENNTIVTENEESHLLTNKDISKTKNRNPCLKQSAIHAVLQKEEKCSPNLPQAELTWPKGSPDEYQSWAMSSPPDKVLNGQRKNAKDRGFKRQTDLEHPLKTSVQFSSAQSCPTLCKPMDCSTPGFSVHHQLPELTQTHVH
ncbi:hypothetical protein FD754_018653 [Muntiacus muntjak]|uniref:RING-type E3 ubiquitin transferase n=1 Tax=Muntiacus muntjak TaxID=9888 RepID=A0A5N3UY43_MUNMU|nr:hypothetical protein FD754_018653 [Muntiacus muntjak]